MNVKRFYRATALLLCVAMLTGFAPVLAPTAATQVNAVPTVSATNLVVNGDFEASATELTGWTPAATSVSKLSVVSGVSGNATNMLKAEQAADSGNMVVISNAFAVEAGKEYELSFDLLYDTTVNTNKEFTACVFWYDDNANVSVSKYSEAGNYLDYSNVTLPAASSNWEEIQSVMYAPAGATRALVRFTINNRYAQRVYVDNVKVVEVEQEVQTTTPTTPTTPAVNHVPNGDFENGTTGWIVNPKAGATVTVVTEGAYSGSSVLCTANHTATEAATITITKKNIAVGDFEAVKFSAMSKRLSGDSNAAYIKLQFNDAAGTALTGEGSSVIIPVAGTTDWNEDSTILVVPEGAVKATVSFGNFSNKTVTYMVDNVKLEECAVPTESTDPTEESTEPTEQPTEPAPAVNHVPNGDFELLESSGALKNWTVNPNAGATVTVVTEGAYSGNSLLCTAVHSDTNKAAIAISRKNIAVGDFEAVKLSVMSKRLSGDDSAAYIKLLFDDAAGTNSIVNIATTEDWHEDTIIMAVPAGATKATVSFGNFSNSTVTYMVDNVKLEEYTGPIIPTEPTDPTEPAGPAVNLLNGSFEEDLTSWLPNTKPGATTTVVTNGAYSGKSLLCTASFTATDKATNSISQNVRISNINALKLSVMSKRLSGDHDAYIGLWFYDASGKQLPDANTSFMINIADTAEWTEDVLIQAVPEGTVKVTLKFGNHSNRNVSYMIDDIKLEEYTGPADAIQPAVPAAPAEPSGPVTSLRNGSFEDDLTGWTASAKPGATTTIVTSDTYNGKAALFTANASEAGNAANSISQTIRVNEIKAFSLSVMSKRLTGDDTGYVGLWFYDANNKQLPDASTGFIINIARTLEWREETLIQAVPEGAVKVVIKVGNHSNKYGLSFLVDEIKLEEYTGPASAIQPATPGGNGTNGGVLYDPRDFDDLNNSFEILTDSGDPMYWRGPADKSHWSVMEVDDAPFGKNVLQVTSTGGGDIVRSYPVKAEPGQTYELKMMAKDIKGNGAIIGLFMFDEKGERLNDYCVITSTDGSGKWKIYTIFGETPENVDTIEAWVWYAKNNKSTVQVDGLLMRKSDVEVKPPYQPDAYTVPTVEELLENISNEYPRVFFDGKEGAKEVKLRRFNTLKTKYGFTWNEQYEALLETAETYLNETQVRRTMNTGNYIMMDIYPVLKDPSDPSYRDIYIQNSLDENGELYDYPYSGFGTLFTENVAERMRILSLAYIMTGKTMYSDRAISYAMQVVNWKVWGDEYWNNENGGGAGGATSWMMDGMVAVYDMCHDQLTEEQKHLIERNIIEKGLATLSKEVKYTDTQNVNMMRIGGLLNGVAAVLNEENAEEIKPYIDIGMTCAYNALSIQAYSGNTEGHYYTDFGLESFMPGLGHLYRVTRYDGLISHPFLSEMLPYWTVMWADGVYGTHPNYSDGNISAYMKKPLAILSKLTNNPIIDGFLITAGGTGNVFENFVYLNPDPKPQYLSEHVGIVETIGYGVLRTGFADDDMMMTIKANDSQMGHNHYDQNSIQLNVGGNWLMKDPGAGSYYSSSRIFWTHTGHTTIMVDDNPQMIKGTASLKKVFSNNLYGYLIGSAPEAYGSDYDSQILTKFDRHAIQINHEDKGYYVIIDDLASTKEHVYTWHMYNGARGTFSVDGKEVPALGTAQGNSVSVALGGDMLNLKFVDSDKLTIEDYDHTAGGSTVGYTIAASSAASKTHQFMTLIGTDNNPNVNFVDFVKILNNRRFTLPEYFIEGDINWDSSMPLGQDCVKEVNIDGVPAVFFRGNKVGDWITYPITIEETGTYDVGLVMGIMGSSCQVKASIDDIATKIMDCSGMPQTTKELSFGELELTAGVHTVKLEVYGPGLDEDYEAGYYLVDVAGMNLERVGVETPPAKDLYVTETYDNEEVLGALVNYTGNKFDFLLWSRTEGAVTAGALNTDAQQASVLGLVDGKITEGFAATKATTMTYDGKVLFLAEKDVDIVASDTGWQVISGEAQTVKLTAIAPELDYVVTVNGEAVDTKIVNGILEVAVAEGETAIAVVVNEPELEPSEPTKPSESATEPEKNEDLEGGNAALWIIVAAAAVALAGAAVGIVLFVKKRKTTNVAADEAAE